MSRSLSRDQGSSQITTCLIVFSWGRSDFPLPRLRLSRNGQCGASVHVGRTPAARASPPAGGLQVQDCKDAAPAATSHVKLPHSTFRANWHPCVSTRASRNPYGSSAVSNKSLGSLSKRGLVAACSALHWSARAATARHTRTRSRRVELYTASRAVEARHSRNEARLCARCGYRSWAGAGPRGRRQGTPCTRLK